MGDTQRYSASDIQRYLEHKMTPQEMRDFEKAVMNDPFLSDALEGFSVSDLALAEKHLSEIESELQRKKQKGKLVVMPLQKIARWKVAAVAFVIITGGILSYPLFFQKNIEKDVVRQTIPVPASEMATPKDSIVPVDKPLAKVEVLPQVLTDKYKTTLPISRSKKEAPIAAAKIKEDSQRMSMAGRSEETALINKNADDVSALSARSGAAVFNEQTPTLSEVVVEELSKKRKKSAFMQLNQGIKTDAEPVGGWENFEEYIATKIDSIKASDTSSYYTQNIQLKFSTDINGQPTDIKALDVDSVSAQKAIQIITAGPKWENKKKDKKIKIILPFK